MRGGWWTGLFALQLFNALSAVGGGVGLVFANGLGMPSALLAETPFPDFVIPGLILMFVVGGTQLTAAGLQWYGNRWWLVAAAVAGAGMIIWIFVEVAMLPGYSFLHTVYFASGLCQLTLVFLLLHGWPRSYRQRLRSRFDAR